MSKPIEFIDLAAQRARLAPAIDAAISRVLVRGRFILGPEVPEFEARLAAYIGVRHVISCANGTDALQLVLRALGVGPGDGVFVPAFTFAATAEVVRLVGATPIFVDIEAATFNLSAEALLRAVNAVTQEGRLRPAGVIPVDLFGQAADYRAILPVAEACGIWVLEDAAQAMGGSLDNQRCGAFGVAAATSFFPAKPLGAYGDGGAVLTNDDALAESVRSLRMHGQGTDKYDNVVVGTNSRLDTIQAAILIEKLKILDEEMAMRQTVATRYGEALRDVVDVPWISDGAISAWAQYTIRTSARDALQHTLKSAGVPSAVYYPRPLPHQTAYREDPVGPDGYAEAEAAASSVLSLPMHPYLETATQDRIIEAVSAGLAKVA